MTRQMTLREIQDMSLEILKDVHSFCIRNGITYSLAYGTLIGAVRHKGFIPWDDDIDIMMPRQDYERFLKTYSSERFRLLSQYDGDSYIAFSRVYDEKLTALESTVPHMDREGGVWIDIFPLDGAEDDFGVFSARVRILRDVWLKQLSYRGTKAGIGVQPSAAARLVQLGKKMLRPAAGRKIKSLNRVLVRGARSVEYASTSHFTQLSCIDDGEKMYQLCEDFSRTELMPFEDASFCVLNGYDRVLRNVYGDYMELPPEDRRVPKQTFEKLFWK